jgi:micrococcal nuclease
MFTYEAEVVNVVDGDTVDVDIDLGFNTWVRNIRLRLNRINAYETKLYKGVTEEQKRLGIEGREKLFQMCQNAEQIVVTTIDRGKYGRWIAELVIDGVNVSDYLVESGYAIYQSY